MTTEYNASQHILRWSEINSNSTKYDRIIAAPGDSDLRAMWITTSTIGATSAVIITIVMLGILLSRKVRASSFNQYLVYAMASDLFFAASCAVVCSINASLGHFISRNTCRFQVFYLFFTLGVSTYLNAIITFQVHSLLSSSYRRCRYFPPTSGQVARHAAIVYLWVIVWALLQALPLDGYPTTPTIYHGYHCLQKLDTLRETLFFWLVTVPIMFLIPYGYIMWAAFDIWRRHLLPPQGKRRQLTIYFFRLIIVFLVFWGPPVIVCFIIQGQVQPWAGWSFGTLVHLQGPVSAILVACKDDIRRSVTRLITCRTCCRRYDDDVSSPNHVDSAFVTSMARSTLAPSQLSSEDTAREGAPPSRPQLGKEPKQRSAPNGFSLRQLGLDLDGDDEDEYHEVFVQTDDFQYEDEITTGVSHSEP